MSIHWYNLRTTPVWCAVCPGETLCGGFSISIKASKWVVRCLIEWDIRVSPQTAVHSSLPVSNLQLSFTLSLPTHSLNMTSSLPLSLFSLSLYMCLCLLVDSLTADIMKGNHWHTGQTSFLRHYFPPNLTFVGTDITTVPGLQLLMQL